MFEIRDLKPEDFEQVYSLLTKLWGDAVHSREEMRRDLMEYIESDRDFSFCEDDEGQIIGYSATNMRKSMQCPEEMPYIDVLVVREGFRRIGVHEKLLERAFELAQELGCRAIYTDSGFQRTGIQDVYKKAGLQTDWRSIRQTALMEHRTDATPACACCATMHEGKRSRSGFTSFLDGGPPRKQRHAQAKP